MKQKSFTTHSDIYCTLLQQLPRTGTNIFSLQNDPSAKNKTKQSFTGCQETTKCTFDRRETLQVADGRVISARTPATVRSS